MSGAPKPKAAITLVLGLGQLVAFASSFYLLGVLGDPIAADLALPPTFVFSLMSVAMVVTPLVAAPYGRWMDAHGGKGMLLLSNLIFAIGLVLLALAQGGLTITLAILVIGLGMAIGLYGTPFAILVSLYGEAARRPITGVALLGALGSTVGWPLTLHFEQALGWRGACIAWALAQLALMPLSALAVPKVRGRSAAGMGEGAGSPSSGIAAWCRWPRCSPAPGLSRRA